MVSFPWLVEREQLQYQKWFLSPHEVAAPARWSDRTPCPVATPCDHEAAPSLLQPLLSPAPEGEAGPRTLLAQFLPKLGQPAKQDLKTQCCSQLSRRSSHSAICPPGCTQGRQSRTPGWQKWLLPKIAGSVLSRVVLLYLSHSLNAQGLSL